MERLVLHSSTKTQVAQFIAIPSHALLLAGSNGIGKTTVAKAIIIEILELEAGRLNQYPYFTVVRAEKNSIPIDAIRELQHFLQLKTLGNQPFRRAVIVEHAEALTVEAQNALLKLLEEPPTDTIMILTADNQRALLPTILSRTQLITMNTPTEDSLKEHFSTQGKATTATIDQAYLLSGGLPGLMHALLENDQAHPLLQGVTTAKEILQKQTFERLALIESLSKQKDQTKYTLDALQHIAQTMLDSAAKKADTAKLKQWHHILKATTEAHNALNQNANTKLVLDNLMLSI